MRAPGLLRTFGLAMAFYVVSIFGSGNAVHGGAICNESAADLDCRMQEDLNNMPSGQGPECVTEYEFEVGIKQACGTFAEYVKATKICQARYEALTNHDQNSMVGIRLSGHCNWLHEVAHGIYYTKYHRDEERKRIEDAHRQLRALGAEQ